MGTYKRKTVEVNAFTQDLEAIKKALIGDEYQSEGLIARLIQIEARLGKLEQLLERARYTLIGLSLLAVGGLYDWVSKLIRLL